MISNGDVRIPPQSIPNCDLPAISATFNRHKYYSKLVHHSDDRMVGVLVECYYKVSQLASE